MCGIQQATGMSRKAASNANPNPDGAKVQAPSTKQGSGAPSPQTSQLPRKITLSF